MVGPSSGEPAAGDALMDLSFLTDQAADLRHIFGGFYDYLDEIVKRRRNLARDPALCERQPDMEISSLQRPQSTQQLHIRIQSSILRLGSRPNFAGTLGRS
jgi:hypothetical protein